MSRHHDDWTDRFSDYLAGELAAADVAALEEHLGGCRACRELLAGLRDVVARAGELDELEPPEDLWPGIASAIGVPPRVRRDPSVIELASVRPARPAAVGTVEPVETGWGGPAAGRARLGVAAAALVAVSVAATWWVATARVGVARKAVMPDSSSAEAVRAVDVDAGTPPAALAGELAALEEVMQVARGALDPNTVRVLERNLAVIERAIADSREALALDPGNAFLTEHLARMYRRKLVYLQDVVRVVEWSG